YVLCSVLSLAPHRIQPLSLHDALPIFFTGFDAYKKVLESGVDMVILATPPGFRPIHFAAAIEAGKHVFFEKPVGVDPVGIRKVRSEEHTSELQSHLNLVCRLLLEKKKQ